MNVDHSFEVAVEWNGNRGTGTSGYREYGREHTITAPGKHAVEGSAAKPFHGDPERWNPEEMLMGALAQCHLLSYLYVASKNGIIVESYTDAATGTIHTNADNTGAFDLVTLHPIVTISAGDPALALALHDEAERLCFIAASVNFPVMHEPRILVVDDALS